MRSELSRDGFRSCWRMSTGWRPSELYCLEAKLAWQKATGGRRPRSPVWRGIVRLCFALGRKPILQSPNRITLVDYRKWNFEATEKYQSFCLRHLAMGSKFEKWDTESLLHKSCMPDGWHFSFSMWLMHGEKGLFALPNNIPDMERN